MRLLLEAGESGKMWPPDEMALCQTVISLGYGLHVY